MIAAPAAVRITEAIVEIVLGSSNDRSNDEDRLSGERQADAFQADETGDEEQAVDVNEVRNGWHGDEDQNAGSSVSALTLPILQVASVMTAVLPFMTALPLPIEPCLEVPQSARLSAKVIDCAKR